MKTLNRTLSLTLVFALVFSLMSFAFADTTPTTTTATAATKLSEFTDASKVTYPEAADYLIAAGIVNGDTPTTLNPQGELTREQAAKLITYACIGQTAADNLRATSAPFTDVAANRWSAGYIAYCQKQGIISGMGDGTFHPADKVTGYQYGKMLLCALGYGVNGEFTGAGWTLEVAKYGLAKDIYYNHTVGASDAPANREEAFLYTFNALQRAMIVNYNNSLKVYYSGTNPFENNQTANPAYTIGYQRFKMVAKAGSSTYNEATHYWTIDGKKVTATYANDPIVKLASSANGTTYDKLTNKGNAEYIGYSANTTVSYFLNGDASTLAAVTAAAAVRGNVINFYDTDKDGKYDTVEALVYSVVKLDAAPSVKTAGGNSLVTIGAMGMTDIVNDNITGDYASLKKDDYVLYYSNAAKTDWTIAKCDTVAGQLYGFNGTVYGLNVNGANYYWTGIAGTGKMSFSDITATSGLAGTTFYLDAGKNIVAAVPTQSIVAATNVAFVLDSTGNLGTVSAKLLKSDGSTVIKTISKVTNGSTTTAATWTDSDHTNVPKNSFFTFTEDANGVYTLKTIAAAGTAGVATQDYDTTYVQSDKGEKVFVKGAANFFFKKDAAAGTSVRGTNSTVFVLEGDTASTVGTYKAYTGVSSIPNVNVKDAATTTAAYVLSDKDGYAIMAVALRGDLDSSVSSYDYAFIGCTPSTVSKTSNASENYYTYQYATVNGAIKTIDSTTGCTLNPGLRAISGYEDSKADSCLAKSDLTSGGKNTTRIAMGPDNLLSLTPDEQAADVATGFTVNGNTVTFTHPGGTTSSFVVSNDVKVFFHDCTDLAFGKVTLTASTLGALENLTGTTYTISALSVSKDDPTINELYITINPKTVAPPPVITGIKSVTSAAGAYTVNYYGDTAPTAAQALAAVQAQIAKDGFVITKTTFDGTKYSFTVTLNGIEYTNPLTFTTSDVVKLIKVTLPTSSFVKDGLTYTASIADEYVPVGAITIKVAVKGTSSATNAVTLAATKGTVGATAATTLADGTGTATTAGMTSATNGVFTPKGSEAVDALYTVAITSVDADTTISIA